MDEYELVSVMHLAEITLTGTRSSTADFSLLLVSAVLSKEYMKNIMTEITSSAARLQPRSKR